MNMKLFQPNIETFLKSAETGSFSKAAAQLYISVPAAARQINVLEKELGFPLFVRTHRGLKLTPAGQSFYTDMKKILSSTDLAVQRAREKAELQPSRIRLGISMLAPGTSLISEFPTLRQKEPWMELELVDYRNNVDNAHSILANLGTGIDVVQAFYDQQLLERTGCQAYFQKNMPLRLAVPVRNPLSEKQELCLEDLRGSAILMPAEGLFKEMDAVRQEVRRHYPEIRIEDFSVFGIRIFSRCENENIALLAVDDWQEVHPLVKLMPVRWNHTIPFGILYSRTPSDQVRWFLKALQQAETKR